MTHTYESKTIRRVRRERNRSENVGIWFLSLSTYLKAYVQTNSISVSSPSAFTVVDDKTDEIVDDDVSVSAAPRASPVTPVTENVVMRR